MRLHSRTPVVTGATSKTSGHPTADGRTFADLNVGTLLDGAVVEFAETIPHTHSHTYDILPAPSSGDYFANGLRIGSTLAHSP